MFSVFRLLSVRRKFFAKTLPTSETVINDPSLMIRLVSSLTSICVLFYSARCSQRFMVSDGSKIDEQQLRFPLHLKNKKLTLLLMQSGTENKDKQNSEVEINFCH